MRMIKVLTVVQEFNVPEPFNEWSSESQANFLAQLERQGGYKALSKTMSLSYPDSTPNVGPPNQQRS